MSFFDRKWRLCACRINAGYSQKEVAKILDIAEITIINWENGTTSPNMDMAQKLSELYVIPLAYMEFSKEGNKKPIRDRLPEEL